MRKYSFAGRERERERERAMTNTRRHELFCYYFSYYFCFFSLFPSSRATSLRIARKVLAHVFEKETSRLKKYIVIFAFKIYVLTSLQCLHRANKFVKLLHRLIKVTI